MDSATLGYLAGVVDSDGFIGIQRQAKAGRVYFNARLGITGTRREPHDLATSIFGGKITQQRSRECLMWVWVRHGGSAVPVLEALLPHLRIKRLQAEIALQLQAILAKIGPPRHRSIVQVASLEDLCLDARALNVRHTPTSDRAPGAARA